jgi:WD40 repeat protein
VARPSPLDHLDPTRIPEWERYPGLPNEAVAVIGSHRGRAYGPLKGLTFSPNGRWLISGGGDECVHFWDPETLQEHDWLPARGAVEAVAFSPDGKQLAVVSREALEIWSVGEEDFSPRQTLEMQEGLPMRCVAWSSDGTALAVGGGHGEYTTSGFPHFSDPKVIPPRHVSACGWVLVYGVRDGDLTNWATLTDFKGPVETLAFSPDGAVLAAGGDDNGIALWDVADLTPEARQGRDARLRKALQATAALATLLLVLGGFAYLVRRYHVRGWWESQRFRKGILGSALVVGVGLLLAACGADRFYTHVGLPGPRNLLGDGAPRSVSSLAFSPDGATLVAGMPPQSGDATVAVWRRREGGWWQSTTLSLPTTTESAGDDTESADDDKETPPKGGAVESLAFSPDGMTLVACGSGRNAFRRTWRLDGDIFQEGQELGEGPATATRVAFSPDGRLLALGEAFWGEMAKEGAQLVIWEAAEGGFRRRPPPPGVPEHLTTGGIWFSHDGGTLALKVRHGPAKRGEAQEIQIWDLRHAIPERRTAIALERGEGVFFDSFSADGKVFLTYKKNLSRLWDVSGERPALLAELETATAKNEKYTIPLPLAISPKGQSVVVPGADGSVRLFDVHARGLTEVAVVGSHVKDYPSYKDYSSYAVKFSREGDRLAVFGDRRTIRVWDVSTRPPTEVAVIDLPAGAQPTYALFSPDGRMLHMKFGERLWVWSLADGRGPEPMAFDDAKFDAWEMTDPRWLSPLDGPEAGGPVRRWDLSGDRPQLLPPGKWPGGEFRGVSEDGCCLVVEDEGQGATILFRLYNVPDFSLLREWRIRVPGKRTTLRQWLDNIVLGIDPGYRATVRTEIAPDHRHAAVTIDRGPVWVLRLQEYDECDRRYAACEETLRRDPNNVAALLDRSAAHLEKRRYDEALADAEAAVQHGGGARAYHLRGLAHAWKGDYAKAKADLDRAYRLDPAMAERAPPGAMDRPGKQASEPAGEKP